MLDYELVRHEVGGGTYFYIVHCKNVCLVSRKLSGWKMTNYF